MSARMTAVDAQFYWMSAKVPSDDFMLYAFEGEPTDFERAVDEEVNLDEVIDRILPIYMAMKGERIQTEMDLYRITHPLRLAKGSHQPGSGKGCAMNVISYINGDTHITDFPDCSARPLATFVQVCNDRLAGSDDYLSPENSLLALELGQQTVGTSGVDDTVIHAWVAELLASPTWRVVRYAKKAARYAKSAADKVILDIAELHRAVAAGDMPPIAAWDAADRAARTACRASKPTVHVAGPYAVRAAYQSTALVGTDRPAMLDAVTGNALRAYTLATGGTEATPIVELTRHAIRACRTLAGLNTQNDLSRTSVDSARQLIAVSAYAA